MKMRKLSWSLVSLLLIFALVFVAGCSSNNSGGSGGSNASGGNSAGSSSNTGSSGSGGSGESHTVTVAISGDIQNFNPYTNQAVDYFIVRYNVFESLVQYDTEMNIVAGLAKDWKVEDTKITFTLNDGITFHDGSPLTADDVRYSLETVQDPNNASWYAPYFEDVASVEGSGKEVIVNLKQPNPVMLSNLANFPIVRQGSFDTLTSNPIGTGPFVFESWSAGDRIVLKKNTSYWNGDTTNIDTLVVRPIADPAVRLTNLFSGTVDIVTSLQPSQMYQVENRDGFHLVQPSASNQTSLVEVVINNNEAFKDPRVMKALVHALDKQTILTNVYNGYGKIIWSPFPSGDFGYREGTPIPYNLDEARRLLTEAGYGDGFTFSMILPTGFSDLEQIAVIWGQSLSQIGVNMEIEKMELNSWVAKYVERSYEMTMNIYPQAGNDASVYANLIMLPLFEKSLPDPAPAIELIQKAATTMDEKERLRLYAELQDLVAEQMPIIPIQETPIASGVSDAVSGVDVFPTSAVYLGNARVN